MEPLYIRAQGVPRTGERLTLTMKSGKRPMTFRPTVLEASENQTLEWLGRLGIPGIFDGQHRFELNPLPGGGTHLIQSEIFSGLLVPLMPKLLDNTREGFRRLNEALAHRAEENNRQKHKIIYLYCFHPKNLNRGLNHLTA